MRKMFSRGAVLVGLGVAAASLLSDDTKRQLRDAGRGIGRDMRQAVRGGVRNVREFFDDAPASHDPPPNAGPQA